VRYDHSVRYGGKRSCQPLEQPGACECARKLGDHPRVHFHCTPTSASWRNQVECSFGIVGKQSLGVAHFSSKAALHEHIDTSIAYWNDDSLHLDETRRFDHPLAEANA
jgi:hypothetical protein